MSNKELTKKTYSRPIIEKVIIDKNISLVMMSGHPTDPPETQLGVFLGNR